MTLLLRRSSLVAVLALSIAGLQPALAGSAGAAASLGTPGSLAPNSGSSPQKDPVLSWSPVSGASGYIVELSKSDDFSDASDEVKLADAGVTPTTSYALPQSLLHDNYFWRVRATTASDKGDWSADAQVDKAWTDAPSTAGSTPGSVLDAAPANLASAPWRFAWTPLPDASTYEVQLSTLPGFPQPGTTQDGKYPDAATTVDCLTTATSFTPYTLLDSTPVPDNDLDICDGTAFDPGQSTVYWRVRGLDDSATAALGATNQLNTLECSGVPDTTQDTDLAATGAAEGIPATVYSECSEWSTTNSVASPTVSAAAVTTPGTVSGVTVNCPTGTNSDFACTANPEISWQPTAGITQYAVTIADDASFTNVEHLYRTSFLSLTPRAELANYTAGAGYHIAVQACTDGGTCGTATVVTVTKRTPAPNGLSAAKVPGGEMLSWNNFANRFGTTTGSSAVGAEDYQVEVTHAGDADFDSPDLTTIVDGACDSSAATCYASPSTTSAGTDETFVQPKKSGDYIWRVSAVDETGNVLPAATSSGSFTIDTSPPVLTITTKSGVGVNGPLTISKSETVTGASSSTVKVELSGTSTAVPGTLTAGSSASTLVFKPSSPLITGGKYVLSVDSSVKDQAGNSAVVGGNGVRVTTKAPDTSKGWKFGSGWKKQTASGALSGSYMQASKGHSATLKVVGSQATLYACKSPAMGKITVTVGGHSTTVSEHQSFTRCGVAVLHVVLPKGEQTITLKVAKGKGNIDEVAVS